MKKHSIYLLLFFLFACSSENTAWDKALNKNTISAYKEYISSFPNGNNVKIANDSITNRILDSAINLKLIPVLTQFILDYPENKRIKELKLIIETSQWENAKYFDNVDDIQAFIDQYPNSIYLNDAKLLLDEKYKPSRESLQDCLKLATRTYIGTNYGSVINTTILIRKSYEYDKKLGYMRVEAAGMVETQFGKYSVFPEYYKVTTDGKGKWFAVLVPKY